MTAASSHSLLALASILALSLAGCSDGGTAPADDAAVVMDDAATNDTNDPFATPSMCSSRVRWFLGDHGSLLMHPGRACIACHTSMARGPVLTLAGTVYPSAHEPDDCYGADGLNSVEEMHIIVTDAHGAVQDVLANQAGNFYSQTPVVFPITAVVSYQGHTRAMTTPSPSGDCNSCHTESGIIGAPGRIMLP